ncbi:MAG TPA: glycosyltransferase [Acidobacteriota bacterium]|jgi:glycosyltransferase involved in cell wall biosynthesis|nr:glycosyltransferase [Acidobacteriota bacterium]MEC7900260.1 glycosyltransferase [Acidobacteriota bacterium]HJO30104.1 glycosyltransferase [Acidobacteriota bacterium]|tara:strand:- start:1733 stop:2836 length:1104 start_codon:yes stop_codon:yes gene_type:complete
MKVALVHDWLTGMRGGERVLEQMIKLYPDAEIHTLLHIPGTVSETIEACPVHTTFIQRLPYAATKYRWYLPVFPWAVEELSLSGYDLVISSSHCVAKSVITDSTTPHLCYCHTPMRYAWDQFDTYFSRERYGTVRYATIRAIIASLRRWDRATASRVDAFAANSAWVAGRIRRYYGRSATVIPPPVDTEFFVPEENVKPEDYYLVVSALSPYKCNEVVFEAFNRLQRRLVVVGTGPDKERLEALAGPTVEMLGRVDGKELRSLYQGCSGVILAAVEDAGIVPVEVMACGRPPLVLARGGASETIRDGVTGTLIQEQTPEAIIEAIDRSEATPFNSEKIRASALRYAPDRFLGRFSTFINTSLEKNLH